jgi:hypothetical protein
VDGLAPAEPPAAALPPAAPARDHYFLPDAEPLAVDERELHDLMKLWRHGRATRTIGQALQDGYVAVFTIVVLGAMVTSVVLRVQAGASACTSEACASARLLMPSAMVLVSFTLSLSVARLFGPVLASAAEGFWLMDAPISRRRLLRGRLLLPVVIAGVVGAVITGLVSALAGMAVGDVVIWSLAAGLGSAALIALAAAEQGAERTRLPALLQGFTGAAGVLVLLAVVAISAGWLPPVGAAAGEVARWIVIGLAVAAGAGGALAFLAAGSRLESIRRARLLSGGSLVSGMQGAMFALDFGLVRDILVERRAADRGHVTPRKGRGLGLTALIWRDVERLWREPRPFIALAISAVVPYAADALRVSQLNPLVSGVALFFAMVPFLGSLRVLTRSGGLARALPFKTSSIRTAVMAVPAALVLLWALVTIPAFVGISAAGADRDLAGAAGVALATAVAGLFGAVRWVTAKKVDFGVPMLATESGAMPPTLLFNLFRGFDMVLLITAPLILQAPVTWSLGLAAVVFIFLRGTFNMDELNAEKAALDREKAAGKSAKPAGDRIKVRPPGR